MSAQDVYALPAVRTSTQIYEIGEEHLPELDGSLWDIPEDRNTRVEVRFHGDHDFDGRRIWQLASCWFDGVPVMIIQNGGREGRDHQARFITDAPAYVDMLAYIVSLYAPEQRYSAEDVIDPATPLPELTSFWSCDLDWVIAQSSAETGRPSDCRSARPLPDAQKAERSTARATSRNPQKVGEGSASNGHHAHCSHLSGSRSSASPPGSSAIMNNVT